MKTSTFYDFCQPDNWRIKTIWFIQSLFFKDVYYYYDKKQGVYCREIKNVKGEVKGDCFVPDFNLLVNYKQFIDKEI